MRASTRANCRSQRWEPFPIVVIIFCSFSTHLSLRKASILDTRNTSVLIRCISLGMSMVGGGSREWFEWLVRPSRVPSRSMLSGARDFGWISSRLVSLDLGHSVYGIHGFQRWPCVRRCCCSRRKCVNGGRLRWCHMRHHQPPEENDHQEKHEIKEKRWNRSNHSDQMQMMSGMEQGEPVDGSCLSIHETIRCVGLTLVITFMLLFVEIYLALFTLTLGFLFAALVLVCPKWMKRQIFPVLAAMRQLGRAFFQSLMKRMNDTRQTLRSALDQFMQQI